MSLTQPQFIDLSILERVARRLEPLNDEIIYVGGAVLGLYVSDYGAEEPRPTTDIDVSVQISTYSEMNSLAEELSKLNVHPASDQSVIYRYVYDGIFIDFIPFKETPLGPTNRWLKPGFKNSKSVLVGKTKIKILPVTWYLATKWEAFKNRGSDPRTSHDFEDIVYILDNNSELVEDIKNTNSDVQVFLAGMSQEILGHSSRNEIIECHLSSPLIGQRRELIINKLQRIDFRNNY